MHNYLASFLKSVHDAVNFILMAYFVQTCPSKHLVMRVVHMSPRGGAIVSERWKKKHYLILGHHQCPLILPYESNKNSLSVDSALKPTQICVQPFQCNSSLDTHLLINSCPERNTHTRVVLRRDSVLLVLTVKRVHRFAVSDDRQWVVLIKFIVKLLRFVVRMSQMSRAGTVERRVMLLTGVVCVTALRTEGKQARALCVHR